MNIGEPVVLRNTRTGRGSSLIIEGNDTVWERGADGTWRVSPVSPSAALDMAIRELYASVKTADVQRAIDLRQRFARRLRRFEARRDSGPGRRRARGYYEERA